MLRMFVSPPGRGLLVLLLVLSFLFPAAAVRAQLFTVQTAFTDLPDLPDGGDRWQASFFLSGGTFEANFGFSVAFEPIQFSNLESPPPPVADWDLLVLQPDPALPASGLYDALALVNGASLAQPFTVSFLWHGVPGTTPGSQTFRIDEFDAGGNFLRTVQSGSTLVIPEPCISLFVLAAGLAALGLRRGRALLAACLLAPACAVAAPLDELSIDGYELVGEQRITRSIFEYTYRARVRNSGTADARRLNNVAGTVTSTAAATVVVDAQIAVGTLLVRGLVTSSDTFSIRQDRTLPFDPASLRWSFTGTVQAPSAPSLTNLVGPGSIARGASAQVMFNYADADGDLDALIVTVSNDLGNRSARIGADRLALTGTSGTAALPLGTDGLPFGVTNFTAQLRDHTGALSASVPFTVNVVGAASGGVAPVIVSLAPEAASYTRPTSDTSHFRPRFVLQFSDPDADIDRARIRVFDPESFTRTYEENAASLGLSGSSGRVFIAPFDLRRNFNVGTLTYRIEVTLVDRNGNQSALVAASFTAPQFSGGARSVAVISSASPLQGPPGTEVTIFASPLEAGATYLLELNGLACPFENNGFGLVTRIPAGAVTGPFTLTDSFGGRSVLNVNFVVPSRVTLDPTEAVVPVGQTLAFAARPGTRAENQSLVWRVNGVVGGNASIGTISAGGVYTAPAVPPKSGQVEVTVALNAEPAVTAAATLQIVPPAPLPGMARILAARGGSVVSEDGRSGALVLPNALAADTTVTVRTLTGSELPPPRPGRRVLGAVVLGPSGTSFSRPVAVTIPLARAYPPGTVLPVVFYTGKKGGYVNEGTLGEVSDSGDRLRAPLNHFSTPVVDEPDPVGAPTTAPTVTEVTPATLEEGARTPIRLSGSGLSGDLRVEVRDAAGNPTSDLVPDTLYTLDDQAGLTLEVRPLPGFDSGNRTYRLRLVRPNGAFSETSLTVTGLPELIVPAGATVTVNDPTPRRFSTLVVHAGARLVVDGGLLDLTTTGPVVVDGIIDAKGADGASGVGQAGGAGHAGLQPNSRGGQGRSRDNFVSPLGPGTPFVLDVAPPAHYGQPGTDSVGFSAGLPFQPEARPLDAFNRLPGGLGGYPGRNYSPSIFTLIGTIAECVVTFGIACPLAIAQLIEEVNAAVDAFTGGTAGTRGLAAVNSSPLPSASGGGGGGGGRIELSVPIPFLGDVAFNVIGGGGGAGGEGGSSVRLSTLGSVRLGTPGALVDARGGNGGDGARTGVVEIVTTVLFIEVDRSIISTDAPVSPGGGGGGGRSGQITLAASAGIFTSGPDQLRQGGGRGGAGGVTFINPNNRSLEDGYRIDSASDAEGTRRVDLRQTVFDPLALATRAIGRSIVQLQSAVLPNGGTRRLEVIGEQPNQRRTVFAFYNPLSRTYFANLVLFRGFNEIDERDGNGISLLPAGLRPRLLAIFRDTDGDGLSDGEELELGTDPNVVDSDGDGLGDGDEIAFGSNPLIRDTDGDGLSDGSERLAGTNPGASDTDGDGFFDGAEIFLGSNPLSEFSTPANIPAGTLFGSSTALNGSFLTLLNPASGTDVGLLGRPNGGLGFGLAFDESTALYTANFDRLAVFHPLSMTTTPIGSFGQAGGETLRTLTLAFNPVDRWLYGIELGPSPDFALTAQLLRINPLTGAATRLGPPGARPLHAIAFTRDGALLAAVAGGAGSDLLIELDPATGALVRDIGPLGFGPVFGLAITRQDTIYGSLPFGDTSSRLLTIDPATGAATPGPLIARNLFDLSVYPCPAPCLAGPVASPQIAPMLSTIALAAGDFDADGNPDVIVLGSRESAEILEARPGDGAGGFADGARFPQPGSQFTPIPEAVVTADFNGDGRADMVADNNAFTESGFIVYLAHPAAAGGFNPGVRVAGNTLRGAPVAASFNPLDDASIDLAGSDGAGRIRLLHNDGLGNFTPGALVNVDGASVFAAADFNGDGFTDLVVVASVGQAAVARVYLNDGHGVFSAPPLSFPLAAQLGSVSVLRLADFDGDGRLDLLFLGQMSGDRLALFRQTAPGTFAAPLSFPCQQFTAVRALAVGDLTGDGLPDIGVLAGGPNFERQLQVYVGDRFAGFRQVRVQTIPGQINGLAIGDFDRDGRNDLVVGGSSGNAASLLFIRVEPSF